MTSPREVLTRLFEAASLPDLDGVLALWDDDGVLEDMTLERRVAGKAALSAYLQQYFAAFPDLKYLPQEIWTWEDHGVVMWEGTTVVRPPFFEVPAVPTRIQLRGVDLFWIRNGRVARERSWYGDGWLFRRLSGADLPSPPGPRTGHGG